MGRIYLKTPIQNIVSVEKMVSILYFEYQKDYKSKGQVYAGKHDKGAYQHNGRNEYILGTVMRKLGYAEKVVYYP